MDFALVAIVALLASGLTLFSGFGLGTLLLPAFAAFFPPHIAVGATAIVHFANNCFKLALVGRRADRTVVVRFGIPAIVAAAMGAFLLERLAGLNKALASYDLGGSTNEVTPVGLVVGGLIVCFALLEWSPWVKRLEFSRRALPVGGVLSGFFGGLSGHQGALRSAFLIRLGLDRDRFIGSAAVCSAMVDFTRLAVYAIGLALVANDQGTGAWEGDSRLTWLIAVGCVSAFLGAFLGARLVKKVTLGWVQAFVAVALLASGLAIALGLI